MTALACAIVALLLGAIVVTHEIPGGIRALPASGRVADFSLLDHEGRHHQLSRYAGSRAVVIFVYGIGCNIARDSLPALNALKAQFSVPESGLLMPFRRETEGLTQGPFMQVWQRIAYRIDRVLNWRWRSEAAQRNVAFLMLDPAPQDERQLLRTDAEALSIDFPILRDETQLVAENLKIGRTAEALLIDTRTWSIVYRGPVDDRVSFEAQRSEARNHYLRDAIAALVAGRPAPSPAPPAELGCAITQIPKRTVSYSAEVAPLLLEKCVTCHQAGGVAPWAMDRYATVKGWSAMIREVVMNRRMPPWHADPAIGHFSNDRSLTAGQVRTLTDWIDAGAPRDDRPDPLAERPTPKTAEWPLGPPDLIVEVPRQEIPTSGVLDYRYIDVPLPLDREVWVRAVHLQPSNPAVVHHAFAFLRFPAGSRGRQFDFKDGANGFFAAYVAGFGAAPFPAGSGQLLPKGTVVQFQLHYAPVGRAASDITRLGIYLHDKPPARELVVASAVNASFRIPPQLAEYPVEAKFVFDEEAELHALFPHMHLRARRFSYEARYPDGRTEALLSVPRYQFNWQGVYQLATPKPMRAGTEIIARGAYDNSKLNPANPDPSKVVHWGLQAFDEMFVGYMLYTVPRRDATQSAAAARVGPGISGK